jgi:hypothetical protein
MPTYYASPTGSGDGLTPSTPMSVANAKAAARAAVTDVDVVLRGGTYVLATALAFTADDSGGVGKVVRWRAYGGEVPVLSGGVQIAGWTLYDAGRNIWRAAVPSNSRQLYVNGARAQRVRTTARGFSSPDNGTTYASSDSTLPTFSRPEDLEFVFTGTVAPWMESRICVASATRLGATTTCTMEVPGASGVRYPPGGWGGVVGWPSAPSYIENAYELLSAGTPGQWYLDPAAGFVYYVPRPGEDMATADVRLPVLEQIVTFDGVSDVEFYGIAAAHAGWLIPTTLRCFLETQANDHRAPPDAWGTFNNNSMPSAAVDLVGCTNVTFTACTFQHFGGHGVHIGEGSSYCSVARSTLSDISGTAMRIGEHTSFVPAAPTSHVTLRDSIVHDVAVEYQGGVGVWVGFADHIAVLHNEIYNLPYTAISLGWGWSVTGYETGVSAANEIAWNKIHDAMRVLDDGAGVYVLGVQGSSARSAVHDNYVYALGHDGASDNAVHLYADEGCHYVDFTANVCVGFSDQAWWFHTNGQAASNTASGNFASYGLTTHKWEPASLVGVQNATGIAGTAPAGWPAGAQGIAASAGPGTQIDVAPPVVDGFTVPASPVASASVDVTIAAWDDVAPTGYAVTVDSLDLPTSWQPAGSITVALAEGTHTLRAYARDAAGNVSAPYLATITVEIPVAPPVGAWGVFPMKGSTPLTLMRGTAPMDVKRGTNL